MHSCWEQILLNSVYHCLFLLTRQETAPILFFCYQRFSEPPLYTRYFDTVNAQLCSFPLAVVFPLNPSREYALTSFFNLFLSQILLCVSVPTNRDLHCLYSFNLVYCFWQCSFLLHLCNMRVGVKGITDCTQVVTIVFRSVWDWRWCSGQCVGSLCHVAWVPFTTQEIMCLLDGHFPSQCNANQWMASLH